MQPKLKLPEGVENKTGQDNFIPNGNFTFRDDFTAGKLDYRWIGLRGPREEFIETTSRGLRINPMANTVKQVAPTSTLFLRQMHNSFSYTVTMDYVPQSEKDLAGIVALQSERFNYVFGISKKGDDYYLLLEKTRGKFRSRETESEVIASTPINIDGPIRLQVSAEGDDYRFSYSSGGNDFKNLGGTVSGDILSTDVAGGFTGCLLGLYATSGNDAVPE